jgi:hypothetical protein
MVSIKSILSFMVKKQVKFLCKWKSAREKIFITSFIVSILKSIEREEFIMAPVRKREK